jgi:hypothetical protein
MSNLRPCDSLVVLVVSVATNFLSIGNVRVLAALLSVKTGKYCFKVYPIFHLVKVIFQPFFEPSFSKIGQFRRAVPSLYFQTY